MSSRTTKITTILSLALFALAGCSLLPGLGPAPTATRAPQPTIEVAAATPTSVPPSPTPVPPSPTPFVLSSASKAAGLRASLDRLLSEHVVLASSATGAALANRQKDFEATAKALDENSVDLSKAIGAGYGDAAEKAFLPLWRKHIGLLVDYTTGVSTKSKTKSDKALSDLNGYADELGAFFNSANSNLPKATVSDLVKAHVAALKDVIDAQAAGDYAKAYAAVAKAVDHADLMGIAIAVGSTKQFPDKFPGDANADGATLRAKLTLRLSEHTYLVSAATAAGLGARDADFKGAASALDANSSDLALIISSIYGDAAGKNFLALWRRHIGLVMDYAGGVAVKDKAKADKAVEDLNAYAGDFGAFFNSANPNLPKAAVMDLLKDHIVTLKAVIDTQATGDSAGAFAALRQAYAHMSAIADPLADAIVKQFPDKFK